MKKHILWGLITPAAGAAMALGAGSAQAATITLPLGNEHTGAYIESYYTGGTDSVGSTGPDLGFAFSSNATVQKAGSNAATGAGKFENNPSGQSEILYFAPDSNSGTLYSGETYMDFASGFNSVSFNYSMSNNSTSYDAVADIWSGLNGTGTLLGTIALNSNGAASGCSSRQDAYCTWYAASSSLTGKAESITFGTSTTADFTEIDGVTVQPVPLPAAAWLLLSGAASFFGFTRKARRA